MREALLTYFAGEKSAGFGFGGMGLVAVVAALLLWRYAGLGRGMAWPLAIVGLIELAVGISLYLKTDGQVAALLAALDQDPAGALAKETARMGRVMSSFTIIEIVESFAIAGGLLAVWFLRGRDLLVGISLGVVLQGAAMLAGDVFAERRAEPYVTVLRGLPAPSTPPGG